MIVFRRSNIIWEKLLYSGIGGFISAKWLYSGKRVCIWAEMVVFGLNVLFGKSDYILRKWL